MQFLLANNVDLDDFFERQGGIRIVTSGFLARGVSIFERILRRSPNSPNVALFPFLYGVLSTAAHVLRLIDTSESATSDFRDLANNRGRL